MDSGLSSAGACMGVRTMSGDVASWVPVATALAGVGGALGSQWLTHRFTVKREKTAAELKLASERAYIGSQFMILLADYREDCTEHARFPLNEQGRIQTCPARPDFSLVTGNWASLSGSVLLGIRRLPMLQKESEKELAEARDKLTDERYPSVADRCFLRLAYECDRLIGQLMKECNLPSPWALDE